MASAESFWSAALEAQFGGDLRPAVSDAPEHSIVFAVVGHEHLVQHHLVEVVGAGEKPDRPDVDAGGVERHDELAQSRVAVSMLDGGGAGQDEKRMGKVGARRPHLGAGQLPAAVDRYRTGAHARQI